MASGETERMSGLAAEAEEEGGVFER